MTRPTSRDLAEALDSVAAAEAEREADRRESQRLEAIHDTIHNRGDHR